MLTLKLINAETERVIAGLEKKHFNGAREAIEKVQEIDRQRRTAQQQLDANKAEGNQLAKQIGALMKQGQREEAEAVKQRVGELKACRKNSERTNGSGRARAHHPTLPDSQHTLRRGARRRNSREQSRGEEQSERMYCRRHRGQLDSQPHQQ